MHNDPRSRHRVEEKTRGILDFHFSDTLIPTLDHGSSSHRRSNSWIYKLQDRPMWSVPSRVHTHLKVRRDNFDDVHKTDYLLSAMHHKCDPLPDSHTGTAEQVLGCQHLPFDADA